ncbi:MAG: TAT-variant-translocated molybdopterin oxidoreductase [Candidatus Cyclobacteriaceae bacterium M2_1C_046]
MKKDKKVYWKGLEQLTNNPDFVKNNQNEFPEFLPTGGENGPNRRDFLKLMGFGIAAASLAACEAPVRKAIPYVVKPVDVDPGVPNYYASTYSLNGDYCSIVVKTREGRPIKIEGNNLSPITKGGTSAAVQASVLTLYDSARIEGPLMNGEKTDWQTLDTEVKKGLAGASNIRILSNTILSPTTKKVIEDFKSKYGSTKHVMYDAMSHYGMMAANRRDFGKEAIPSYHFNKADVIVSFEADFLGTWISPVEFNKQYSKTRKLYDGKVNMSRHYQFESVMTVTGGNADYRTPIKPSQEGEVLEAIHTMLGGGSSDAVKKYPHLDRCVHDLKNARGKSLVVSGSNDPDIQSLVNAINQSLGSYGNTIDMDTPVNYRQGNDEQMTEFINDVQRGAVDAVIFYNCNPVYNHPMGAQLAEALNKIKLKVSTSDRLDETSELVTFIAPDSHYLESWNDANPKKGHYSFQQPAITKIFNTRQAQESFLLWSEAQEQDYFNYLKKNWEDGNVSQLTGGANFQKSWDKALMDGVIVEGKNIEYNPDDIYHGAISTTAEEGLWTSDIPGETSNYNGDVTKAITNIRRRYKADDTFELSLYQKVGIGEGAQANNPWLQEMPDPITRATWDNYLTVPLSWANENDLEMFEGNTKKARITVGDITAELPVMVQPGQARNTVGIALGYGRSKAGLVADGVGVNANPFVRIVDKLRIYNVPNVTIELLGDDYTIAQTQTQHTYMGRETVIQESILPAYKEDPSAGRFNPKVSTWMDKEDHKVHPGTLNIWKGHQYKNHHWGLIVDLNSCTGCGACTVSCQAENNIPVVGRQEVINKRDMHWIRIDRYYSSEEGATSSEDLEKAAENPQVVFQPMMCQHCNNAPCETVCPVAATTHSSEGLNQMAYNRCIGTRYCANNCPYKVRRFNWFKYHHNDSFKKNYSMNTVLGKMVLNPDVTVRSRGVMEKCTMCVQRIQYGKLEAKKEGRRVKDQEVITACASACPTDALIFGDMNDKDSLISRTLKIRDTEEADYIITKEIGEPRAYHVLEEIATKPNVTYLTKIKNRDSDNA